MSKSSEMAKRTGVDRSQDYVPIPDSSELGSKNASQKPRTLLRRTLLVLVTILYVMSAILVLTIAGTAAVNMVSPIRAGCEVTTDFTNTCSAVFNEVSQRIDGQYTAWHDPHNNGSYIFTGRESAKELSMNRISGFASKVKYTDKVHMSLTPTQNGEECRAVTTSDSQVFSILDFGTNFCNINNLYCSAYECHPFDVLTYTYSVGKCTDSTIASCYTV